MKLNKTLALTGGLSLAVFLSAGVWLFSGSGYDRGGNTPSQIKGNRPNPENAPMKPVGSLEADKRAAANNEHSTRASEAGKSYVAPPVIADIRGPELGELPEKAPDPIPQAPPQPIIQERIIEKIVYVQAPQQPQLSKDQQDLIMTQIQKIVDTQPGGGFVVRTYLKGERKQSGSGTGSSASSRKFMIARAGDVAHGRLDRGFNSDDPAAPIFATIQDIDEYGRAGPLHFARMMGAISYSKNQAGIHFNSLTFADGQTIPIKAIAISVQDARVGIATDIDNHYLYRYGALFLSSFLQGVGQVGQTLVGSNRTVVYDGNEVISSSNNKTDWKQVGMGTLLPVGQTMASAFAQNVNRAPTLSSPQGMPMGIVFLEPVVK